MKSDPFERFSDAVMLPVLEKMPPIERKKLLFLHRQIVHPRAYAWIDRQLAKLSHVALDPDWEATVKCHPRVGSVQKLVRQFNQVSAEEKARLVTDLLAETMKQQII